MCAQSQRMVALVIFLYGDESTDETSSRVCAVAGVIGMEAQWLPLEQAWVARSEGIPFHAKDCDSDHGDFAAFSHSENKDRYKDMAMMLASSGLWGIGVPIDMMATREMMPGAVEMAYYRAFLQVIDTVVGYALDKGGLAKCAFDTRIESNHNAGILYASYRESHPEWKATLADEISFVCSRKNPRVQIADLFAREAMKHLDNQIGPVKRAPRKSWKALEDTGNFILEVYDRKYIEDMAANRNVGIEDAVRGAQEYKDWIGSLNRQDNTTAVIEFMKSKNHDIA